MVMALAASDWAGGYTILYGLGLIDAAFYTVLLVLLFSPLIFSVSGGRDCALSYDGEDASFFDRGRININIPCKMLFDAPRQQV
jgi:hypothetical protein